MARKITGFISILLFTTISISAQQLFQKKATTANAMPNGCGITVNAGPDITICAGTGKTLNGVVTNSTDYSWEPPDGLSNSTILKPLANPSMTTTYTLTAKAMSGNLITNGNFETGSIAPASTGYTQYTNVNNLIASTGGYMIMSVPQIAVAFGCNPNIGAFTLVITPTGSGTDIWCQTKTVNPNTDYKIEFKVFGILYLLGSPPSIGLKVNGTLIGNVDAISGLCLEADGSFVWNSGSATSATFCLANYGGTGPFSMCAIDDITVKECCVEKDEVTVTVYDLVAEASPVPDIDCLNKPLTIDASASSQGPGITYNWSTKNGHIVSGDKTLMPVIDTPGTYTLKVIGLYGCEKELMITVNGSVTKPDIKIKSTDITCLNATASNEASTKSSSPQFEWNGPNGFYSTRAINNNLKDAGEYIVKVTDAFGCESTSKVEIKDNRVDLEAEIIGDSISCAKDSAVLKANSIAINPIYNWSGPLGFKKDSANRAVTKDTGWYYLSTTDSAGCKELDSFYVVDLQNSIPVSIQTPDTLNCNTSDVILRLRADTSVTIQWSGPNGFASDVFHPSVTQSGWYYVTVTTKAGCKGIDSVYVPENFALPDVFISGNDTVTCDKPMVTISGGSISTGNQGLEWKTPSGIIKSVNTIQVSDSGMYTLYVTAINGCTSSKSVTISKDIEIPIISGTNDTLTCDKDSLNLNVSANKVREYSWTGPNNFTSKDSSPIVYFQGNYTLIATGNNGCQATKVISIDEDKNSPILIIVNDTINCIDTMVIPNVTCGNTVRSFSWTGPNGFVSSIKYPTINIPGVYNLTITGKNGCKNTGIFVANDQTQKPVAKFLSDSIKCKSIATIRAQIIFPSVANIEWKGPNGFNSNSLNPIVTEGGFYYATVTGYNGCVLEDSIFVFQKDQLPDIFASDDTLRCDRPKLFLSGGSSTPNVSFEWTGPNGFISNLPKPEIQDSGIYTLKVTDPNGCEAIKQIYITKQSEAPMLSIQRSADTLTCKDSLISVQLTANQNSKNILWLGPNGFQSNQDQFSINQAGTYLVIFTNDFGCIARDSFSIQDFRSLPNYSVADDSINCKRLMVNLQLSTSDPNLKFSWSGPSNFTSNLQNPSIQFGGTYTVVVSNAVDCQLSKTVFIKADTAKPDLTILADTLTCLRSSAPVKAGSSLQGFTMKWTGPNGFTYTLPQFATKIPGRYYCTITNPRSGCSTTDSVDVLEDTSRIRNVFAQSINSSCNKNNGKITITRVDGGKQPYRYSLDNGITFINDLSILDLAPGTYTVITEDVNGCRFTNTIKIDEDQSIDIQTPNLIQLKSGETGKLQLNFISNPNDIATIFWSPSDQLSCNDCADPVLTGTHDDIIFVTVTDKNGCIDTASIRVQILIESKYYFPNAFSPNGDNINDYFYPIGLSTNAKVNYLKIFDRWGNLVFQKIDFQPGIEKEGWDGRSSSQEKLNPGVYVFLTEITDGGQTLSYFGDVTLIR
jgi:gliding motility-associated-like protein